MNQAKPKAKEFWIYKDGGGVGDPEYLALKPDATLIDDFIHVIDYESFKIVCEALKFYADKDNWDDDPFCPTVWNDGQLDMGKIAREALEKVN
ncbi:MAG: hypothetical protein H7245_09090 [Candidatus Saccharibacteria bacterium]|nr:hypothetical protein [Pseudorhodobacter sp.]